MPYLVNELITNSYYLSGIVSRDFQTVSGSQISDGLDLLNSLLSFKTVDCRKIPYFTEYNFTAVINQEKYFIPGLIQSETLTYLKDSVRFYMDSRHRKEYFGSPRPNTVTGPPYQYHVERCLGGANLYIYFLPDFAYAFTLWGNFSLSDVTIHQDLEINLDKFYIEYLRYLLAAYICEFFEVSAPSSVQSRLTKYESQIMDVSPTDFTTQKRSTLTSRKRIGLYGMANIGRGYVP